MPLSRSLSAVAVVALLLLSHTPGSSRADGTNENWLRGSGDSLEICLRGEVVETNGEPATGIEITGGSNSRLANLPISPTIDGHRFELWLPVNQAPWYSLWLKVASSDGDRVAYRQLNAYELRQVAIESMKFTLQRPTRQVKVKVLDAGRPVEDAWVKAELGFGIELRSRTDADGIAQFGLLPKQDLSGLMAWTDDFRIGGFSFHRKPTRDPASNEHVIELSRCRDQKFRFVDEEGSPVPGIDFTLQMATPPPDYNYLGTNEHSSMTSDAAGEVNYQWFPDWEAHHFYTDLRTNRWVLDGDHETIDDAVVFHLKKSKVADRKRVNGRVVSDSSDVGGFFVTLRSFQGERENYSDSLSTFTDADGSFSVDVLPDATYCAYVLDSRWVGEIIDLLPYDSKADRVTPPELSVSDGQLVEVTVTTGLERKPYSNLSVHLRREHHYTWQENGQTRNGTGGPQWWVTTDEAGRATTRTLPGKLKASVYSPLWRTEETVNVRPGEAPKIHLHRELEEKRTVTGRLVLADGVAADLKDAEVRMGAVDGNYNDQQSLTCDDDGSFSFETVAAAIGIFGCTQDGQAAGSTVVTDLDRPVEVVLRPTMDYAGQLLGEGDEPLADHPVRAIVRVEGREDYNGLFIKSFEARRIETKTDEQGNFTLRNIPAEMKTWIQADALNRSDDGTSLEEVYLEPGESRPRVVSRLAATSLSPVAPEPLEEKFNATLRDCALGGYHLMLIVADGSDHVGEFVDRQLKNYRTNEDNYSYMQLVVTNQAFPDTADAEFLKLRNWPAPQEGRIFACALDADGNELGRLEIDVTDETAIDAAADFVRQHAPAKADAEKKWNKAFAEAKQTDRLVWVRISQRYCGPCFRLSRWLDDQHDLLQRDYVMLKIDNFWDTNGASVAERLTRGEHHGVPFHAIFNPDGELLIDSAGPLGNIGHPSGFEGKKQLRKMLLETCRSLTDDEVENLVESVRE